MNPFNKSAASSAEEAPSRGARFSEIESANSPNTRHVDDNVSNVFTAFIFAVAFIVAIAIELAAFQRIDIWAVGIAFAIALLAALTVRISAQWERVIVLRLGKFSRVEGPGMFLTIPFIEHIALRADLRTMLTGFGAEEILTSDLVPVDVDAAIFWMVWDAEKACMEVENYYDAVSMAAQTALRDAIGRKSITDVTVHRDKLDQELRDKIEEKAGPWGISIISVEIRDIVIPKQLQSDMAATAKAERESEARIMLAEVEKDVAAMLHDAAEIYREDDIALSLRKMHLVNESLKESPGSIVVPSSYAEGFVEGGMPKQAK